MLFLLHTICIHYRLKVFEVSQCKAYFMGHIFTKICLQNERIKRSTEKKIYTHNLLYLILRKQITVVDDYSYLGEHFLNPILIVCHDRC